jgi:hypothetical protein
MPYRGIEAMSDQAEPKTMTIVEAIEERERG